VGGVGGVVCWLVLVGGLLLWGVGWWWCVLVWCLVCVWVLWCGLIVVAYWLNLGGLFVCVWFTAFCHLGGVMSYPYRFCFTLMHQKKGGYNMQLTTLKNSKRAKPGEI